MPTLNEAKEAVYLRFTTQFTGTTNVVLDNEEPSFDIENVDEWVRLVVRTINRNQDTLGKVSNRRFRSVSSVFVQVYTKVNTGVKVSDTLATEAARIFEGVSFSGLDFREAIPRETGPDGKWYQIVVEAPFDYDEIR